jgi:Bacterial nucleoid DNA-binding protein
VTKKEIIEIVSTRTNTRKAHTRAIIESMLDVFIEILSAEGRIEVRNFGVFKVKETPARIGRNPVTREVADVPARRIIQFKARKNHEGACEFSRSFIRTGSSTNQEYRGG